MKAMSESQFQNCEVAERSENPNGIPQQSPALRGTSYLGKKERHQTQQPQRGCDGFDGIHDTTPLGLGPVLRFSQGSSFLATLGWRTQSLRDWRCLARGDLSVLSGPLN